MKTKNAWWLLLLGLLAGPAWAEIQCSSDESSPNVTWYTCQKYNPQTKEASKHRRSNYKVIRSNLLRYWVEAHFTELDKRIGMHGQTRENSWYRTYEVDCQAGTTKIISLDYTGDWGENIEELRADAEHLMKSPTYFSPDSYEQTICDHYKKTLTPAPKPPAKPVARRK